MVLLLREGRERVGKRGREEGRREKGGRERGRGSFLSPPTFPSKSTPLVLYDDDVILLAPSFMHSSC